MDPIKYEPTDGLSYNPNDDLFWNPDALKQELTRVFEVCHGCRLCFKYCPSFPTLFDAVDANDGNVTAVGEETTRKVVDQCFQCKACYVNCPYTPGENHKFQLDFPQLMFRAKAQRAKQEGIPLREKLLSDPVKLGKVARLTPGMANFGNTFKPLRLIMEKTLGIHRDKQLPEFHGETFRHWFDKQNGLDSGDNGKVVLFDSCFVNYNDPDIGKAVVEVLARNGIAMRVEGANCCGMPALDTGDFLFAREQARRNVEVLYPLVAQGIPIAVVNPTCSLMLKQEYPELLAAKGMEELLAKAQAVSENTYDICEYLFKLRQEEKFDRSFLSTPGVVAYHLPCHLRAQNIGFRSRDLMRLIPGVKVRLVSECCGHDGTWAMKVEHFAESIAVGKRAFDGMKDAQADVWATDCPLAAIQIEQHAGKKPLHPVQILARAYRADGFAQSVQESP